MGELILFEQRRQNRQRRAKTRQNDASTGADIVFFTGVRYVRLTSQAATAEHMPEPDSQGRGPSPRGRKKRA